MLIARLADLANQVGEIPGNTDWITVDQQRIDTFADATEDHQWIHVDSERAARGPFGGTIAHGYLTLSLVSKFLDELVTVTDAGTAINYGLDRMRLPQPVLVGSRLRGTGSLLEVRDVPGGVQTTIRISVEMSGSEKPALVADILTRFLH